MDKPLIRPATGSHLEQAAAIASNFGPTDVSRTASWAAVQTAKPRFTPPRGNVVAGNAHRDALSAALTEIALVVGRTLGPHGSNALIRDEHGAHFATKDGYTVLQRLTFVQETATMVLDHVRSISRALVRRVGDGSTSAVIMADSLYESFLANGLLAEFPPGAVQAAVNAMADTLAVRIRSAARRLDPADDAAVETVATIAANNDPWAGRIVAQAYREGGADANVFVALGGDETTVSREPGYRVLRGMAHECFANEVGVDGATPTTCRLRDAAVMVFGDRVGQHEFNSVVAPVMNECLERGQPFVLVAREYVGDVLPVVAEFKRRSPGAQLLLLDHAMATRRGAARLGDLAAVLGATLVQPDHAVGDLATTLGRASEVRSTMSETVFLLGDPTLSRADRAAERADALRAQINRLDTTDHSGALAEELEELRARLRALTGSEITISVGGATEQEKKTLQYLLDDAALAVRAALRSGVVEGLGFTSLRALSGDDVGDVLAEVVERTIERTHLPRPEVAHLSAFVFQAVRDAYVRCAGRVLENSRVPDPAAVVETSLTTGRYFNALTRSFADTPSVLNPADTDIEVLRGAASIVSLLVTSDQTVLVRPVAGGGLD